MGTAGVNEYASAPAEPRRLNATDLVRLRQHIADVTTRAGLDPGRAAELALAVNEVASNAIEHGDGMVSVTVRLAGTRVVVEVRDGGPGIPAGTTADRPEPDAERGRGLWLVGQLCDEVDVESDAGGTRVRLAMALPA
ncbi:hypothetical protein GCM10023322_74820 [Rugosimonospora acidiphila]|uniref:Histidine kinase/HSP90-like ATPase domain-containing protein n=1 Tax=Rugosimonospora acidiphila TaxID=556531 RepID=A0ABP9SRF1_9ACTN